MSQFLYYMESNDGFEEKLKYQNTLPLMSGPIPLLSILAMYLLFVTKLGPYLMAHRKPYNMQALVVIYNFAMVLYNVVLVIWPIVGGHIHYIYIDFCIFKKVDDFDLLHSAITYAWCFFLSKLVELIDTIFFVMRKKQRQITFLHVFHHVMVPFVVWFHNKYMPGPQALVVAVLNSSVHVFMYTYYMLSAMGPKYQKYIWWKKYMTWIQLVQFVTVFLYTSTLLLLKCPEPAITSTVFLIFSLIFMLLFANFYYKTYIKKSKQSQE
ncbi:very long chain fatty acid elongase 7-like isoform X2 [Periplaneta americana]